MPEILETSIDTVLFLAMPAAAVLRNMDKGRAKENKGCSTPESDSIKI